MFLLFLSSVLCFLLGIAFSFSIGRLVSPQKLPLCAAAATSFSVAGFGGLPLVPTSTGAKSDEKEDSKLTPMFGGSAEEAGSAAVAALRRAGVSMEERGAPALKKELVQGLLSGRARGISCWELDGLRHKMATYLVSSGLMHVIGHMDVEVLLPIIAGA